MKIAQINGVNIHFADRGNKDGPVIVFSNSLGSDFRLWDRLYERLSKSYRIINYDKRGHGLSGIGITPYSISMLSDDLAALLDHLNIEKAILCGISVGGMISQQFAASHPSRVRGLILCNTGPVIGTAEFWGERMEAIEQNDINFVSDAIISRWFSASFKQSRKTELEGWRNMLIRTPKQGYLATCEAIRTANLTDTVGNIDKPALCIAGDEDLSTPPALVQEMSSTLQNATFVNIDEAGHLPPIEKPDLLASHINDFIEESDLG